MGRAMSERIVLLRDILRTIPGNSIEAQRNRLMVAMQRQGYVTTFEASRYLDCYDPRARIHELRNKGQAINTMLRQEQTESGEYHRVGVYFLQGRTNG